MPKIPDFICLEDKIFVAAAIHTSSKAAYFAGFYRFASRAAPIKTSKTQLLHRF
jgi:hypothetical protein